MNAPFLGVSWVFPGCFLGVSWVFPGCFLGVSRVFPGSNFLFSFTLLKIPTTFAKEVFSKPAPLMQNIILMFSIKGVLEKKTSLAKVQTRLEFGDNYANLWSSLAVLELF